MPHGLLSRQVIIKEPGYAYIYLSNEGAVQQDIYFDDLTITHKKSPIVQSDEYYPFGLTFNSYQKESTLRNDWKFQGQEHEDALDLNWDQFKWRNHQPEIGRFFNVDPLADKYVHNSPYAFSENKVTAHVELEGLEAVEAALFSIKYSAVFSSMKSSSSQGALSRLMTNSSKSVQGKLGSDQPVTEVDSKPMAKLSDASVVADKTATNAVTLTNDVSKDGLGVAKAIGTGVEIGGLGSPVSTIGVAINSVAGVLDEARQVAFEGKTAADAGTDVAVDAVINGTFTGLGNAAKASFKGTEKGLHDTAVDGHSFGLSNLFQWVTDKIRENVSEKKDDRK
jgi:RHS repeat-associated protein